MNLIEELKWRGLLHDIMPGTEKQLAKEMTKAYAGFDPTADSLHIGNLVPIIVLMHLQKAGHAPLALVGGATGMIGDPSGKSTERNLLDIETLRHNEKCIQAQLSKFLDFDENLPNKAQIVNNYDWFKDFLFLDFIRDIGKHITVNYMLSKDSVKKRLEGGMSFTEFTYQLIQGYDFYYLYKTQNVKIQAAGSDQWGNIVTGTELIRRKADGEAFAFTAPLVTKADGTKFGKSESGNIWLDAGKTSPYKFYQFWLKTADADAEKYIKIFTFLPKQEIDELIEKHKAEPHLQALQKALAAQVTTMVHGDDALESAIKTTEILFKGTQEDLFSLSQQQLLDAMEGVSTHYIEMDKLQAGENIVNLLAETGVLPSKTEARKMLQANSIAINMQKAQGLEQVITENDLLHNKYILVKKGKKDYYLVCTK